MFIAIARTADAGTVDLSTVMITLESADSLPAVGGFDALSAAVQESFTSTAPTDHVARIADRAAVDTRRQALQQAAVALDDGQDLDTNRAFLMDALASTSTTAQLLPSISDQVNEYFALLDQRLNGGKCPPGCARAGRASTRSPSACNRGGAWSLSPAARVPARPS